MFLRMKMVKHYAITVALVLLSSGLWLWTSCDVVQFQNPFLAAGKDSFASNSTLEGKLVMNGTLEGDPVDIDSKAEVDFNAHNYYEETGKSNIIFVVDNPYTEFGLGPFDSLENGTTYTFQDMYTTLQNNEAFGWVGSQIFIDKYDWSIWTLGSGDGTVTVSSKTSDVLEGSFNIDTGGGVIVTGTFYVDGLSD